MSAPYRPTDIRLAPSGRYPHEQAPQHALDVRSGHTTTMVEPDGSISHEDSYQVPPGTAQEAAQEAEQPSMVDQLQQDAAAADAKVEYPEGAPKLRPLLRLPFKERAIAARKYAEVQQQIAANKDSLQGGEIPLSMAANLYEVLGAMDEFLSSMAVDPAAYQEWPGRYSEAVFIQTWNAYEAIGQTPEA